MTTNQATTENLYRVLNNGRVEILVGDHQAR